MPLEFKYSAGGVHRIHKFNRHMGAIVRNGKKYDFLPEPFVAFTKDELEQIIEKIKELDANAT